MDFFKANDVLKGPHVSAATTDAEKVALRREKLEACKVVVDHLFTPPVMFVKTKRQEKIHQPTNTQTNKQPRRRDNTHAHHAGMRTGR